MEKLDSIRKQKLYAFAMIDTFPRIEATRAESPLESRRQSADRDVFQGLFVIKVKIVSLIESRWRDSSGGDSLNQKISHNSHDNLTELVVFTF